MCVCVCVCVGACTAIGVSRTDGRERAERGEEGILLVDTRGEETKKLGGGEGLGGELDGRSGWETVLTLDAHDLYKRFP